MQDMRYLTEMGLFGKDAMRELEERDAQLRKLLDDTTVCKTLEKPGSVLCSQKPIRSNGTTAAGHMDRKKKRKAQRFARRQARA